MATRLVWVKQIDNNLGQNININLRVPIFSQLQNKSRINKERLSVSNAQLDVQDAKNEIENNTLQVIQTFNSAKMSYAITKRAMEENLLSYEMFEEKYKVGQVSSIELFSARDILNVSNSKFIQAKLQLYFQYQLLQRMKSF